MEEEKVEIIKVIDRGKYCINFIKRSEDKYKDISLLYEEIAKLLYERHLEEIKK